MRTLAPVAAIAAGIAIVGCVVHQQETPGLSGPSQLANVLTVTATPDAISQNGGDQSTITVTATGPSGPLSGLPVRLDMLLNGAPQDFGTLSARNIVTNSSGVATAAFTAPPTPAGSVIGFCQATPTSAVLPGNCVTIRATPTGTTTFAAEQSFTTTIRLVPPGIILPPVKTPKAAFTFLPSSPLIGQSVSFNGTTSCAEADAFGNCVIPTTLTITSYAWTFGDGSSGSGATPTHTYSTAGTYVVTLTVANSSGGAATAQNAVTVGSPPAPTADFVVSPGSPTVADGVIFNADTSKSAPGHNIVQYSWNFGDPHSDGLPAAQCGGSANANTASSAQACHVFKFPGTYNVTLSILDDTGQRAVATKSVTVIL